MLRAIAHSLERIAAAAEARELREAERDARDRARFAEHDRRAEEHMALVRQESARQSELVKMQGRIADSVAPAPEPEAPPAEVLRLVRDAPAANLPPSDELA